LSTSNVFKSNFRILQSLTEKKKKKSVLNYDDVITCSNSLFVWFDTALFIINLLLVTLMLIAKELSLI